MFAIHIHYPSIVNFKVDSLRWMKILFSNLMLLLSKHQEIFYFQSVEYVLLLFLPALDLFGSGSLILYWWVLVFSIHLWGLVLVKWSC